MDEVSAGIFHWTALHPRIRQRVSSYYVEAAGALIDPMVPEQGLGFFEAGRSPERIILTNRHHLRQSAEFVGRFGCPVLCSEAGLHEFREGAVQGFAPGAQLAPVIESIAIGAICPDETALHIRLEPGSMAFADGLIRGSDGALGFVPDWLLGEEPDRVKEGLLAALGSVLDRDFENLLFAHGEPLIGEGKQRLSEFVTGTR